MKGIKLDHFNFQLNWDDILNEELPWTQAFYRDEQGKLKEDVQAYFKYNMQHESNHPVYKIERAACAAIELTFEASYTAMVYALRRFLHEESDATVLHYMGDEFLGKYPFFLDYARYTFNNAWDFQALYGRFDAAISPVDGVITGIYEFNGNTPTMLFEAVNLQNRYCQEVTGDTDAQLNSQWHLMEDRLLKSMGKVGVIHEANSFESTATAETIAQLFGQHSQVLFADGTEFDRDLLNPQKPFMVGEEHLDVVFALIPWEELVSYCPEVYADWSKWCNNVQFLEPAWRWFMSNKGFMAYMTHLMETDEHCKRNWGHLPFLPTYMEPDKFIAAGEAYVSKPVIGRMSQNITLHDGKNQVICETDGAYPEKRVYQKFCPPVSPTPGANAIYGMFMSPDGDDHRSVTAGSLCVREFDTVILNVSNERFIPHVLV